MHLFFTPDIVENTYSLNESESKHCIRVLRLSEGDKIRLVNGRGDWIIAQIIDANPKKCTVSVIETIHNYKKRQSKLHIAIAPTKNIERLEWFLEKAAEIGIDEITPLLCQNSERPIIKMERLNKVLISAMKQSLSAYLPQLNELTSLENFLKKAAQVAGTQKFIAHCAESETKKPLKELCKKQTSTIILIGPEGDFTEEEIKNCLQNNFEAVSLSNSRLRTETAGIVACSTFDLINF